MSKAKKEKPEKGNTGEAKKIIPEKSESQKKGLDFPIPSQREKGKVEPLPERIKGSEGM